MIVFERAQLSNGLRVLVHEDKSTQLATFNILYDVGSKDERPDLTGIAHLFEHLMFTGTPQVPTFDEPIQKAGGENNAFTSNDVTSYYQTLPAVNLETSIWLESDRMMNLALNEYSLEIQRKVVIEEFKEHYLNQPYGDAWHKLRAMAYTSHPYRWPTIGLQPEHIAQATLDDVRSFYHRFYCPANAIAVIAGNAQPNHVLQLMEQYFGSIPAGSSVDRQLPCEPPQLEPKRMEIQADVPSNALYIAWHFPARCDSAYYPADIITEILGGGKSGRLFQRLVKEQLLFSEITCYHTGSIEPGLIVIEGKIAEGVSVQKAEKAILEEVQRLIDEAVPAKELERVRNRIESQMIYSELECLNNAVNLAMAELLGDANLVNTEVEYYLQVSPADIQKQAATMLVPHNSSTLLYLSNN